MARNLDRAHRPPCLGLREPQDAAGGRSTGAAPSLPALVGSAAGGDERAWRQLVTCFDTVVRSVARRHRLADADQDDVAQHTWLALVRHIGDVHEPAALSGWLVTTARRESLRIIRTRARERPVDDVEAAAPVVLEAEALLDRGEEQQRVAAVRAAIRRAPASHRPLLDALTAEPGLSYEQVSRRLNMPVGSIGPTRARQIARLRRDPDVARLMTEYLPPAHPTRRAQPALGLM